METGFVLHSSQYSLDNIVKIKRDTKTELEFLFSPLINNDKIFSKAHIDELIQILETITNSKDELIGKLYILTKYFIYLVNKFIKPILIDTDKTTDITESEVIQHIILPLKTIQFLIFIYSFKYSGKITYNHLKSHNIGLLICHLSNRTIEHIGSKFGLTIDYSIKFTGCKRQFEDTYEYPDCLFDSIDKYEFLLAVDKDAFINSVFQDVSLQITSDTASCVCARDNILSLVLNKPKVLDIKKILHQNKDIAVKNLPKSLISYKNLKTDPYYNQIIENQYSSQYMSNLIITTEYLDILRLMNIPSLDIIDKNIIKLSEINPIILRYADVIINYIFRDLTTDDFDNTPISTLYLIEQHILPNLPNNDYTVDVIMFILFRLLIPYIVDMFGRYLVLDYFH